MVWDDREVVVAGDLVVPVVRAEGLAVDVATVVEEETEAAADAGATGTEAPISRTGWSRSAGSPR